MLASDLANDVDGLLLVLLLVVELIGLRLERVVDEGGGVLGVPTPPDRVFVNELSFELVHRFPVSVA